MFKKQRLFWLFLIIFRPEITLAAQPSLVLQPPAVGFNFQLGGTVPDAKSITIASAGGPLRFSIAAPSAPWLVLDKTSGTTPATIHLSFYPGAVTQGTFATVLTVTSPSAPPQNLPVTLVVKEPPTLIATPLALSFVCESGFTAPVQTIAIAGQSSSYAVFATSSGWLNLDREGGTTPDSVGVSVSCAMDPGTYTGTVSFVFADVISPQIDVQVTLNVIEASQLSVSPNSFSMTAQAGAVATQSQTVTLQATGERLNFVARASDPWLSITPDRGATTTVFNTADGSVIEIPISLTLKVDPTGLGVGSHSGNISLFPDDGAPPTVISVDFVIEGNRYRIAQVADGGGWATNVTLVNTDAQPAPFKINFYADDGTPLSLSINQKPSAAQYSDTIPAGGSRILQTSGQSGNLLQGWAEVIAQGAVSGTTIFRQQVSSTAAVEGSVPLQSTTGKHFLLPFDNTENFVTSTAALNFDPAISTLVSIMFRDESGQPISSHSFTLPPGNRQAVALPTQYPELSNRRGVMEVTSATVDLCGFGIRFNPKGAFTSIQPIDLDVPQPPGTINMIPQIADGGQWQTTIIVLNTGATPAPFSIRFFQPGGFPWSLPIAGLDGASEYSDVIPVGGSRILQTNGIASVMSDGWGEIVSSGSIGGTVIFRQHLDQNRDAEGSSPVSGTGLATFILPFDDIQGFSSAAAVANLDPLQQANISVVVRDTEGVILGNESITLGPFAQSAFSFPLQFPESKNSQGVAEFSVSNVDLSALGFRFNPSGSFASVQPLKK